MLHSLYTLHPQYQYNLCRPHLQPKLLYQNNFKLKNKMKTNMRTQKIKNKKKQAHKQTLPCKINATQLTQQRNNPKHANHCKEKGRDGKSLVSLHEKFLGSRFSYAKKNTDAVPFTSICLVPHCKTEKLR